MPTSGGIGQARRRLGFAPRSASAYSQYCSPLIRPHPGAEASGLAVAGGGEVAGYGRPVCAFGLELGQASSPSAWAQERPPGGIPAARSGPAASGAEEPAEGRGWQQRASAARIARSAQSGLGRSTWRRGTITSCRNTMISASFDTWLRPQQEQPARHPDRDQIQQTDRHEPRSCPNPPTAPNRSSQGLHRVLERYRCSACRKPAVNIPAAWDMKNCRQVGPARRGAGSTPRHGGSFTPWTALRRCRVSSASPWTRQ